MNKLPLTRLAAIGLVAWHFSDSALAQPGWHNDVGYTQLVEEFGVIVEQSAIPVALVEGSAGGSFAPDASHAEFAEKNMVLVNPGDAAPSGHATSMGVHFFGNSSSLSPGITEVVCLNSSVWLGAWLRCGSPFDPQPCEFAVSNHSYIGAGLPEEVATNVLQRVDFAIDQSGMTTVVGINNGTGNSQPQLLSHCYNVISVGRTDGSHSRGTTSFYGRGRFKPDIVAPAGTTSAATAMVSSGAALLYHAAGDSQATRPEVLKAILMAGATKSEFETWERSMNQPLDAAFGAGEMNIYHSYRILAGGESPGAANDPVIAAAREGWHYNSAAAQDSATYYELDLPQGADELSVVLCWNINVIDNDATEAFEPSTVLADMDLRLFDSSRQFLEVLIDASYSTHQNIEHIYQKGLPAGRYTLEVRTNTAHAYALAWRATADSDPPAAEADDPQ